MNKSETKELIDKYLNGTCTPEESIRVESWYLETAARSQDDLQDWNYEDIRVTVLRNIQRRNNVRPLHRRLAGQYFRYTAACLIMAAAVWYWLAPSPGNPVLSADVAPGGNRAVLTLPNGRTLDLNEQQTGIVVGDGTIHYQDGTSLVSITDDSDLTGGADTRTPPLLSVVTPRGGQYRITLPDGSRVWLNASSKIRYPASFSGPTRLIELSGEAYFEIVSETNRARQPFIVQTRGQEVRVLGTQFNVAAYDDEDAVRTTLVDGAVQVQKAEDTGGNSAPPVLVLRNPGQQTILTNSTFEVKQVDLEPYIGWKDGWFLLHNLSMRDMMRQLERWYDVEVDYRSLPDSRFYGEIKRDVPLSKVLGMIEKSSNIKFEINGGKIMARH